MAGAVPIQGPSGPVLLPVPGGSAPLLAALVQQRLEATLVGQGPEGVALRLPDGRVIQAGGQLPFPPGTALALEVLPPTPGGPFRLQLLQARPPAAPALLKPLLEGEASPLLARLQAARPEDLPAPLRPLATLVQALADPARPAAPEAWKGLLEEGLRTLSDPAASPREAPFHRLQAQEGTAFYELPLPWAPQGPPVQVWVERDAPERGGAEDPGTRRVLVGLSFTRLGEVRLGLELGAAGFRARVWTEDPARLEGWAEAAQAELAALGLPARVQVLPLPAGAPSVRALAAPGSLSALG